MAQKRIKHTDQEWFDLITECRTSKLNNVNNLIKATTIYSVCHSKIYIIFSSAQDFSVPSL